MFTQYKYEPEYIAAVVEETAANLRRNRGLSNLLAFGASNVVSRLKKDSRRYRDYGPYWPELKNVLRRAGYDFGQESDPMIAEAYQCADDVSTLMAAEQFRTFYLGSFMRYTNQFTLGEDGEGDWTLFDQDMELLA